MTPPLRVGETICASDGNRFPGGHFGRDCYGPLRIEAIGADWVVARDDDGQAWFADVDPERLIEFRDP